MPDWKALAYAQAFRDVISELVVREVARIRPTSSLATVDSYDSVAGTCDVIFPGDSTPVTVRMYTVQPTAGGGIGVGDVVRVEGESTRRHVTEVVKGAPFIRAGQMALTALQTSGSAANMVVDAATGVVYRSTSSRRYKKNIQPAYVDDTAVKRLRPVVYEDKDSDSGNTYLGLIAEEIAGLNDPTLDLLVVKNEQGEPEAISYERLAVVLLPVIQRLMQRITSLEDQQQRNR